MTLSGNIIPCESETGSNGTCECGSGSNGTKGVIPD